MTTVNNKRKLSKAQEIAMREHIKTLPDELTLVYDYIPTDLAMPARVWQSKKYLVQAYSESNGIVRLSINRTTRHAGNWNDKLTWDELQDIKRDVGFGDFMAVEIYPRDKDIVNVANMRHLWVLPLPLSFGWKE